MWELIARVQSVLLLIKVQLCLNILHVTVLSQARQQHWDCYHIVLQYYAVQLRTPGKQVRSGQVVS
jgi:hypothetical protein